MFDLFANLVSSIASFLFPLFASYKALKTSDPSQLTPWLMYWSVLSCVLLADSWASFVLKWIPFYAWLRMLFLLYLVLPQTQGARHLYETYLHPYLAENELAIEDLIASAHDRLRAAGVKYLKRGLELVRTKLLGMPPSAPPPRADANANANMRARLRPQGYTQSLLARFNVPTASWAAGAGATGATGQEFFSLLAGAVSVATGAGILGSAAGGGSGAGAGGPTAATHSRRAEAASGGGTLIPGNIQGTEEKMSFIAQQKEKLAFVMSRLENEAVELQKAEQERRIRQEAGRIGSFSFDGAEASRPPSGYSGLSKSRSEVDFEKIEADVSGDEDDGSAHNRQPPEESRSTAGSAWNFFRGATIGTTGPATPTAQSSGYEKP